MNVRDIIKDVNSLADDQIPDEEVLSFINDAISAINIEVNAVIPTISPYGFHMQEPAIPEKWQRMLIIPFAKARVKEKDSSQFEWEVGYEQFFENLLLFKRNYRIPVEHQDTEGKKGISEASILDNVPYFWGGW